MAGLTAAAEAAANPRATADLRFTFCMASSSSLGPRGCGLCKKPSRCKRTPLPIRAHLMNVALIDLFYANEEWAKLRRPGAVDFAKRRLAGLSKSLGDKPFLDGDRFTAGDLMMTTVLRILKHTDIVTSDKSIGTNAPIELRRAFSDLKNRGRLVRRESM